MSFDIYYDHGIKDVDPHVAKPLGFYGKYVKNLNRITDTDILIGHGNKVILLLEIEERHASPKKVLGNIFANMMCNRYAIKRNDCHAYYDITDHTKLILSLLYKEKGYVKQKITNIKKRIDEIDRFPNGILTKNIVILWETCFETLIETTKKYVKNFLEDYE